MGHISLLAATVNRKESLVRLLDSLVAQSYADFTVLLGDQNPVGYLETILQSYKDKLDIQHYPILPQSLSSARNMLLPHIDGELFAITDDDCYYPQDALEEVVNTFSMHKDIDILVGSMHHLPSSMHKLKPENRFTVFKGAPSWLLFFRRDVAKVVGRFDERLGIGTPTPFQSGEETDYLIRALSKGFKIYRSTNIVVYHPPLDEKNADLAKSAGYACGRMALLQKHRFPFWFKLLNVIMPLCNPCLLSAWRYRTTVFRTRLQRLFTKYE